MVLDGTRKIAALLLSLSLLFFVVINSRVHREFKVNLRFRPTSEIQSCDYTLKDYNDIFLAIQRALNFFQNFNTPILDAAVGTRVLEAQLIIVLNAFGKHLPTKEHLRLKELLLRSSSLSQTVLDNFLQKSDDSIGAKLRQSQWIKSVKLWEMPKANRWRSKSEMKLYFNKATVIKKKNYFRDHFYGSLSDKCIFQQFYCKSLPITPECKDYFFRKPESSYTLNHQIIYAIMAEKNLCHKSEEFNVLFQNIGGWKQFRKDLCGKAFFLANVISAKNFTPRYMDLFTEQVAVCSLAGYPNFLNKDWLYKILSWQTSKGDEGCFLHKDYDNRMIATVFSDDDYEDVEYPLNVSTSHLVVPKESLPILAIKQTPTRYKSNETQKKRHRVKRHERIELSATGEQCLIHLTSMGVMALSIHLRYSIETCSDELFID